MVVNNFLAKGLDGDVQLPEGTGSTNGNVVLAG
jgi:hypothetical protein